MLVQDELNSLEQTCKNLGIPFVRNLLSYSLIKDKKPLISYAFAKEHRIVCLEEKKESLLVACAHPESMQAIQELRVIFGKKVERVCAPREILDQAIEHCFHKEESIAIDEEQKTQKEDHGYDLLDDSASHPTIRLLNAILRQGIQSGASDIHFEPKDDGMQVRYRIDGILQSSTANYQEQGLQLLTRLKVMAQLDIAEKRLPQDGRIRLHYGEREIHFRISTIPVLQGERIVLRILDQGNVLLGLDRIGMPDQILRSFQRLIGVSEGMILVTGPTGSGKTTTLYSALTELPSKQRNIMTIEDPVEYKLEAISQIGVNPKISLTFSKGLKHILRQDPDVILVGEIRDAETAQIAIQASLTGHLVFSTLHTNDAASAITRLSDMGIEPYLLTSSIQGVLAQRLVRKICPRCKQKAQKAEHTDSSWLIGKDMDHYVGIGCDACNHTGYGGRTGIYELITMTPSIKQAILKTSDASEIEKIALKEQQTLFHSGIDLVKRGITTLQEVIRVTNMDGKD
jgi:general secretion pathway protein E